MSRSNSWLANLQPTYGVLAVASEIPGVIYMMDDAERKEKLVVVPGKAHVKRLIDGEMAVCLSRKEALKLAWEILGILKVHFGVGGSV